MCLKYDKTKVINSLGIKYKTNSTINSLCTHSSVI